jgi:hypothetical protein
VGVVYGILAGLSGLFMSVVYLAQHRMQSLAMSEGREIIIRARGGERQAYNRGVIFVAVHELPVSAHQARRWICLAGETTA